MKSKLVLLVIVPVMFLSGCQTPSGKWQPAPFIMETPWSESVPVDDPWPEYPRPGMVRSEWVSLNGLWEFTLTGIRDTIPLAFEHLIRVPFPVESALSGVAEVVTDTTLMWYRKSFTVPDNWKGQQILLHFEASDWETWVYVNGQPAGTHRGGYDPFTLDITSYLEAGREQELVVKVHDPTDRGNQPRGKQVLEPGGIFYTPSSGIWQTVWLEPVPEDHIDGFFVTPDIDRDQINVEIASTAGEQEATYLVQVFAEGKPVSEVSSEAETMIVPVPDARYWYPSDPFLYDLKITLLKNGNAADSVMGYFGMRKVSLGKDRDGYTRVMLNDTFLFQFGLLDQGFWPDGLYTPPSEEAMKYDLEMTQKMGFNMLRKHVKVEPRRFYTWCDRMGMLVWQDMPSCSGYIGARDPDRVVSDEYDRQFRYELGEMIRTLYNHPSIVMWVPFNEGWGQYDTPGIVDFIRSVDPTRLVNAASGWADRGVGDVHDIHHYPDPRMPDPEEQRAIVLGEYGGLGFPVEGHTWEQENWGYTNMKDREDLTVQFEEYAAQVYAFAEKGLSAAVYTQTTDVETETNGLITYDRAQAKIDPLYVTKAVSGIFPPYCPSEQRIFTDSLEITLELPLCEGEIYYTLDGSEPGPSDYRYQEPFSIDCSVILKARAMYSSGADSRVGSYVFEKVPFQSPVSEMPEKQGWIMKIYTGEWQTLPDFDSLEPVETRVVDAVEIGSAGRRDHFGVVWEGYLTVNEPGVYVFYLTSDDGSRMILNGELLIENDGIHGMNTIKGFAALEKGAHEVRIEYFQRTGGLGFKWLAGKAGGLPQPVTAKRLLHK